MKKMFRINIVGAGLAGLSAALFLAERNIACNLISVQTSERAQSVLAEGGINAAMNVSGESDTPEEHFEDTMRGGVWLADPEAVKGLTQTAPQIMQKLMDLGVPFNMEGERLVQRPFGGQKKKRTSYARSSTGKALMTAMIDAVRRFETGAGDESAEPLVRRYPHHRFLELVIGGAADFSGGGINDGTGDHTGNSLNGSTGSHTGSFSGGCTEAQSGSPARVSSGVRILDIYTEETVTLHGPVILAFGGPNGLFAGRTTGTTANDGGALAAVFAQGMEMANLEFIQYHPTTVQIAGKRMLISEAARGEGGRLYVMRRTGSGSPERWYFMEEKYPELGNLMPRDVVSKEMDAILHDPACEPQIYLDLTGLSKKVWQKRLPDLRREIIHYLALDPAKEPVPVSPGIHFFMGGIRVDLKHRTSIRNVYAAGECACQYHGANRLGGNSLLGALYGGRVAAMTAAEEMTLYTDREPAPGASGTFTQEGAGMPREDADGADGRYSEKTADRVAQILSEGLGIVRNEKMIDDALSQLRALEKEISGSGGNVSDLHMSDLCRMKLGEAMLLSARARQETRGAHIRSDYPERMDAGFQKQTAARLENGKIEVLFRDLQAGTRRAAAGNI